MLASGCGTSTLVWLAVLLQLVDDLVVLCAEKLLLGSGQASHPSKRGSSGPSDSSGVSLSGPAVVSGIFCCEQVFFISLSRVKERNI